MYLDLSALKTKLGYRSRFKNVPFLVTSVHYNSKETKLGINQPGRVGKNNFKQILDAALGLR